MTPLKKTKTKFEEIPKKLQLVTVNDRRPPTCKHREEETRQASLEI